MCAPVTTSSLEIQGRTWALEDSGEHQHEQQLCHSSCWVLRSSFTSFYLKISFEQLCQRLCCPARLQRPNLLPFAGEQSINKICSWVLGQEQGKGREDEGEQGIQVAGRIFLERLKSLKLQPEVETNCECSRAVSLIWTNRGCGHPCFSQAAIPLILSFLQQQQHPNATESLNQVPPFDFPEIPVQERQNFKNKRNR